MKNRFFYIVVYVTAGFIFGYTARTFLSSEEEVVEVDENPVVHVKHKDRSLKQRVASLENELAAKDKTISDLQKEIAGLSNNGNPVMPINPLSVKTVKGNGGDLGKLLGNLIEKGLISQNKRPAPSTRDKYAPLIEALGLNAEETDALMALIGGSNSLLPAEMRSYDEAKLKELLGEDGYKTFKEYERELPARLFADDLSAELAEAGLTLSDTQYKELLKMDPAMVKDIPLSYSPMTITLNSDGGEDVSEMVDGELVKTADKFSDTIDYAGSILNEDQMAVFDKYMGDRLEQKENAAATAEAILPGILKPGMLKNLGGGNAGVQSSVTIISDEMVVEEPVLAP